MDQVDQLVERDKIETDVVSRMLREVLMSAAATAYRLTPKDNPESQALGNLIERTILTIVPDITSGHSLRISFPDELLHIYARDVAKNLKEPDRKQLRFNDIIEAAKLFYYNDPLGGIEELVYSCDKQNQALYVKGQPMWKTLNTQYKWMIGSDK